ncbi:DUF5753 domain-containing protein [Kitasatospora sp. HPMI-4]
MTLEALAARVPVSRSHLARIETAASMPPPELPALLDAEFKTEIFVGLYNIARREAHPDRYRRRMELEARARVIEEFSPLVPGLVQTEDYARALFRVSNPRATDDEVDDKVNARMSRQSLLRSDAPPDLSVILDEAAIRRPIGGPAVMRAQLEVLVVLAEGATTLVQVLPFAHGEHALLGGSLTLLTLDDSSAVAYEESIGTGTLLEETPDVTTHRRAYDLVRASALSPRSSATLIREVMEALPA